LKNQDFIIIPEALLRVSQAKEERRDKAKGSMKNAFLLPSSSKHTFLFPFFIDKHFLASYSNFWLFNTNSLNIVLGGGGSDETP
jgi:hypothetical protein